MAMIFGGYHVFRSSKMSSLNLLRARLSLHMAWPLVKQKCTSEVVEQDRDHSGDGADWGT